MNKWINVEYRLPSDDEEVLCWYEYCIYGECNRTYQTYGIGYYSSHQNFWGGEIATKLGYKVIAWMPLPTPPTEKI